MTNASIMIVEDESIVAADIRRSVEAMGYSVCAVEASGEEAVQRAGETRPDIVLMDIVLKGQMDGIEAAGLIAGRFKIPVVYITAYDDEATLARAKITTPYGYLTKPFTDREVRVALDIALYRHQAEKQIKKTERQLAAVLRSVGDAVIASDKAGRVTFMNPVAERLTGWRREDALGMKLTEILNINAQEIEKLETHLVEKVITGGLIINLLDDHILVARDGSAMPISDSVAPIRSEDGETAGTVLVFRDISERKRAEEALKQSEETSRKLREELFHAQKMESIGRLAGGVAHDFNNMLGVILGRVELAMIRAEHGGGVVEDLAEIKKAAERSADITRRLLAFARKQTISPVTLDLNQACQGMSKILQRLIGEDIELAWMPGADIWPVRMDPSQVDQILANLCVNARDAIAAEGKFAIEARNKGRIAVETRNVVLDETFCAVQPGLIPGEYVLLLMEDNGCGMESDVLERLFEPFFTTKEKGKGTGLGLAMIYGIVKQNNGFIYVDSKPHRGTTFRIYLPRDRAETTRLPIQTDETPIARGARTVLVVEDENALLDISKAALEQLGYRVLAASGPEEGIRLAREHPGEIDLLLSDVVMPGMNGRVLADQMRSIRPGIKVLFMSGYIDEAIAHDAVLDEGVHFIQKPFARQELAAKIRETLG